MKVKHYILILGLMLCCASEAAAQRLAVKTDAVKWAMMMPNAGIEFALGQRWTFDISVYGGYKMYGYDAKLFTAQPEVRYWLSGRPIARAYVGATAFASHFDMEWDSEYHNGDALGGGLTFGYAWFLSSRWSIEAYCGFGVAAYKEERTALDTDFDGYFDAKRSISNSRGYVMCPAKLGASFIYIIK